MGFSVSTCRPCRAAADSLLGVKPRRAAYGDKLHGPMSKKLIKVGKWFSAIFAAESVNLLRVRAEDCGDFNIRNRAGSTRMSLADISAADQSDVRSHLRMQQNVRAIP